MTYTYSSPGTTYCTRYACNGIGISMSTIVHLFRFLLTTCIYDRGAIGESPEGLVG